MRTAIAKIAAISIFILLLPTAALSQTTWYVDDANTSGPWDGSSANPFQYIQDGIDAAFDKDAVLVLPGTYLENIDFLGKEIIVTSASGPSVTTIDGRRKGSVVSFKNEEGPGAIIEGFTITNGIGTFLDMGEWRGGGLYCIDSSPTIRKNTILENSLLGIYGAGGGIYCGGSSAATTPWIVENTIHGNRASQFGAGIYCENSNPTVSDNTIVENSAANKGGGIYSKDSSVQIIGNTISSNSAYFKGGGILCICGSPTISENTISDNSVEDKHGGGICCLEDTYPTISSNTITGNFSEWGGGIFCNNSYPTIMKNLISENSANWEGGGIYLSESEPTISNNIIDGNSCMGYWGGYGGGISLYGCWYATIRNNMITRNLATYGAGICCQIYGSPLIINNTITKNWAGKKGGGIYNWNTFPEITNTIIWGNAGGASPELYSPDYPPNITYCDIRGGWQGKGNIDADPFFVSPEEGNFHLRFGSPCVDAGKNSAVSPPETDFEGDRRKADGNWPLDGMAKVDMGADEILCEIAARFGNVNEKGSGLDNILLMNSSPGNNKRVFSSTKGTAMTLSMGTPSQGPTPSPFSLYVIQREPSLSDITQQPYGIGIACMPMPLTHGTSPPPFCIANSFGYFSVLGYPILSWVGPAPCTVISIPYGFPQGTYTLQGYIMDNGAKSLAGLSLTNAIVVTVQ